MHQLPDRIVRPMQGHGMDYQILCRLLQIQRFLIGNAAEIWPQVWKTRHHNRRRKGSINLDESFLNLKCRFLLQEQRRGTGAVQRKGRAVGQKGRGLAHGGET